jgi:hypothetical protein
MESAGTVRGGQVEAIMFHCFGSGCSRRGYIECDMPVEPRGGSCSLSENITEGVRYLLSKLPHPQETDRYIYHANESDFFWFVDKEEDFALKLRERPHDGVPGREYRFHLLKA